MNVNISDEYNCNIDDVRKNWHLLDEYFPDIKGINIVSHEEFTSVPEIPVKYIDPGRIAEIFSKCSVIYWFIYAIRLFISSNSEDVIIVNGGNTLLWAWCGILNAFPCFGKRKLFCWDIFVEYILGKEKKIRFFPFYKISRKQKENFARFILRQYGLNVVWSAKQVETHAKHFNLPDHHFIFLPFKANHSKRENIKVSIGDFIFAGGNGKRDYACLIEAVRNSGIPVIISATDPLVQQGIEQLPNVIILGASEPAFGQLQAASRMVVIPMIYSGLKGGGEANFCNGMWHGKPVIGVDSMAAEDYIVDGETGYVVQSGDFSTLRERIIMLWSDQDLCFAMGEKGRLRAQDYFTHYKFIRRLLRLALLYGYENEK